MGNYAIIDASTIEAMLTGQFENFFATPPSYFAGGRGVERLRQDISDIYSKKEITSREQIIVQSVYAKVMPVLEAYLLYDEIYVDQISLRCIFQHNRAYSSAPRIFEEKLAALISPKPFTDYYEEQIRENVTGFLDLLRDRNVESVFNLWKQPEVDFEPVSLLTFKDTVMSDVSAELFGNSSNKPLRALFYHELSRCAEMSLILHPHKQEVLKGVGNAICSDIGALYNQLTKGVADSLKPCELDLEIPPLAYSMMTQSLDEDLSLLEVAVRMKKDNKELASLRGALGELRQAGQQGRLHFQQKLAGFTKEISSRIESRSRYQLPFLSSKTLVLSEIPAVGAVVKAFNIKDIQIPDLILYERPYVTLYDRWANFKP